MMALVLAKRALISVLVACIIGYALICVGMYLNQRAFMYFPGGDRGDVSQYTDIAPQIIPAHTDDDIAFDAWYWPRRDANQPVIVYFHGNAQAYKYDLDRMLRFHDVYGFGLLYVDYRGYGGVDGEPTEQGLYADARAHINALMDVAGVGVDDMVFYGHSLGTGVATQMAVEFKPRAVIYEAGFSATVDLGQYLYPLLPVHYLMKDQYLNRDKIGELDMPTLFIHGDADEIVPIQFGRALYDVANDPKYWRAVPNAGHVNLYDFGAEMLVLKFLDGIDFAHRNDGEEG